MLVLVCSMPWRPPASDQAPGKVKMIDAHFMSTPRKFLHVAMQEMDQRTLGSSWTAAKSLTQLEDSKSVLFKCFGVTSDCFAPGFFNDKVLVS